MSFSGAYLVAREPDGWTHVDLGGDLRLAERFDVRPVGYRREPGAGLRSERVTAATARRGDDGPVPLSEAAQLSIYISEVIHSGNTDARHADIVAALDAESWPRDCTITIDGTPVTGGLHRWESGWVFVAAIDDCTAIAVQAEGMAFPTDAIHWTWTEQPDDDTSRVPDR